MNIGKAIKFCRVSKDISLEELQNLTNLSQSYLSLIENNKRKPTLDTIEKISNSLNVPIEILVYLASDKRELNLSPDIVKLFDEHIINSIKLND